MKRVDCVQLLEGSDELWQELETLRKELESNAASKNFRQVLTQLDVAGRKFSQLQKELRPQLQFYVSHPMYINDYHAQGMHPVQILWNAAADAISRCETVKCPDAWRFWAHVPSRHDCIRQLSRFSMQLRFARTGISLDHCTSGILILSLDVAEAESRGQICGQTEHA